MGFTRRSARFVTRSKAAVFSQSLPVPQNTDTLPVEKEVAEFADKRRVLEFRTWDGRLVMSVERPFAYGT